MCALTHQVSIEPLLGNALKLPEEMKLGTFPRFPPSMQDQVRCQLI